MRAICSTRAGSLSFRSTLTPAGARRLSVSPRSTDDKSAPSSSSSPPTPPTTREYKAWGVKVVESTDSFPAGPEAEKDFWEGEKFQVGRERPMHEAACEHCMSACRMGDCDNSGIPKGMAC